MWAEILIELFAVSTITFSLNTNSSFAEIDTFITSGFNFSLEPLEENNSVDTLISISGLLVYETMNFSCFEPP